MVGILVDVFCLGVKNALYTIVESSEYPEVMARIHANPSERQERRDPAYARKLVEDAVDYAADLGFEPHPDYRIARLIFGDIDPTQCQEAFVFGHQGMPFYVNGPNDTPSIQRRILKQLERRCGAGAYHFMMGFEG